MHLALCRESMYGVGLGKLLVLVTAEADNCSRHAGNCLVQMQGIVHMPLM